MRVDAATRRMVRDRAEHRCEYCRLRQEELPFVTFHIEHIIARQHEGTDDSTNLALSCHWCNHHKGPNIGTYFLGDLIPLFHPRTDRWEDHFEMAAGIVIGLTAIGKATCKLLNMNEPDRVTLRQPLT